VIEGKRILVSSEKPLIRRTRHREERTGLSGQTTLGGNEDIKPTGGESKKNIKKPDEKQCRSTGLVEAGTVDHREKKVGW